MPLTETDRKYPIAGLHCLEGEPKIPVNFQELANLLQLTNPRSAANGWAKAMKKVRDGEGLPVPKPNNDKKEGPKKSGTEFDGETSCAKSKVTTSTTIKNEV